MLFFYIVSAPLFWGIGKKLRQQSNIIMDGNNKCALTQTIIAVYEWKTVKAHMDKQ